MRVIDRFHQTLATKISREIEQRTQALVRGAAKQLAGEVVTTAEKYAAAVVYIEAMKTILSWCDDISADQYGTKREESDD